MVKAIIFDCDGTLVDSVMPIYYCKIALAQQHNLSQPSVSTVKEALGLSMKAAIQHCFPTVSDDKLDQLTTQFEQLKQSHNYQYHLMPNTKTMLNTLKANHIPLAIATSASRVVLNEILTTLDIKHFFSITCCGEEYKEKPDPQMLLTICNKLGIKPPDALMIGDTIYDIQFACNANMPVIAVNFGAHSTKKLTSHINSKDIIANWSMLLQRIGISCTNTSFILSHS